MFADLEQMGLPHVQKKMQGHIYVYAVCALTIEIMMRGEKLSVLVYLEQMVLRGLLAELAPS